MCLQVNAGSLTVAISDAKISAAIDVLSQRCLSDIRELIRLFSTNEITPSSTLDFENRLRAVLMNLGATVISWTFNSLERDVKDMPRCLRFQDQNYRRLNEKTNRSSIVSQFGEIAILRSSYRRGRAGETIFPLDLALGIEQGFTTGAASLIGEKFADAGSSQGRTVEMISKQFGCKTGVPKLRKLIASLAHSMEINRQHLQSNRLLELIAKARSNKKKPVLSVSRDAVALGTAPWGYFEMASVATVSVMVEGKRIGTVYLGRNPEENQKTLTSQLTALLCQIIQACGSDIPEIVYVTDAGICETAYWKNVLSKLVVGGRRIKVHRVVDYYHASERLTKIADALRVDANQRNEWLRHARELLLEEGGLGRVLRSISSMKKLHGLSLGCSKDVRDAECYLRRYAKYMDYASMRERHFPIGSGIVESACKQIISERMKLSGMRWKRDGAQHTITLRCILLSRIWNDCFRKMLESKTPVIVPVPQATTKTTAKN